MMTEADAEAHELQERMVENVSKLLGAEPEPRNWPTSLT